jgi:branched-chain amino acid transport system ATP-binding protein
MEAFPNLKARRKAKTGSLSGGEQQATAIGRALMTNPEILMLDEVSLGLSPLAVDRVYASLQTLMSSGATILLVEQDLRRAMSAADRIICMLEGRIVLEADKGRVGRDEITAAYFGIRSDHGEAGAQR